MYEFEQMDRLSDIKITENSSDFINNHFLPNSVGEDSKKRFLLKLIKNLLKTLRIVLD